MRSKLITAAAVVVGIFLAAPMATADEVQEQLRLMEQRLAEMEDRLQATSEELQTAKETVNEQQTLLSDAGLASGDQGERSGVGNFMKEVDISGVAAGSYNYRFLDSGDDNTLGANTGYFRHPNSNTFALDQIWMVIDKTPTAESRGGFHAEYVYGETAIAQGTTLANRDAGLIYTGYASYLAPIGNGVQFDIGKLATPLGAEVLQTNQNFNVTTGLLFGIQPVTHVGVQMATALTDNIGFTAGIVNDVYTQNNFDFENDKAYYGQLSFASDMFGLNVGAIVGNDSLAGCPDADDDCYTSVFDVLLTMDPSENLSAWINFDWARSFGESNSADGDIVGVATAYRYALNEVMGFSQRFEYLRGDNSIAGGSLAEIISLTTTIDRALTDDVKLRLEARWDRDIDNADGLFVNGQNGPFNPGAVLNPTRDDQVVGLAELYYEF